MEPFQRRRSKITSLTGDLLGSTEPAFREGKRQPQKPIFFPKLASDSSSCSSDTEDDSLTFEVGWRSSKQTRRPIKKLLAEEMSRETQSKRRSPSVIARLMGLDGLPPQQSTHKQQKRSMENYQMRTASVERAQRSGTSSGRLSFRKSSKEEQEFKDVFEVLDASKMESSNNSLPETSKTKFTEAEMVFIKQKFMDVKRLSTDERLQDSKEFHDALEVLDNNKDLLLKFLQQPDSLFTKHMHDLGAPPQSHCGHMSTVTLSHAWNCESSGISGKAERETPWKSNCKSTQKHLDGVPSHTYGRNSAQSFNKSAKVQLAVKEDPAVFPTRIVVLKPNLGKPQAAIRTVSSPPHSCPLDFRKHAEFPGTKNMEAESWAKRNINDDVGFSRHNSKESREIAKEITRKMRNSFSNGSMNFSTSGFKGYAGDESSSNMSGSESANESEFKTVTSRDEFKRHNRFRSTSSRSAESSVCREAKKRLSERWKMSHKSQDLGVISRGSTLGEMLAIPDGEVRPANLDAVVGEEGFTFCSDNRRGRFAGPLGISSRDGWKDDGVRTLSRSRSLPASSTFRSPKASMRRETLDDDRYMMSKETVKRERNKAGKGNLNQKDGSSGRTSRSSSKKSSLCTSRESYDSSPDISFSHHQFDCHFKQVHPSEESFMVSETYESIVTDTNSVPENVLDVGHENTNISSSESPNSELSAPPLLLKGNSSAVDLDVLSSKEPSDAPSKEVPLHHPISGVDSPASSREADQPSPVSILEAPFADDLSCGSEYFGGVSADLHGLRMQLQLLKLESDGYDEGPMLVSSDEDAEERLVQIMDEKSIIKAEENWESSYVADVLLESGLNNVNSNTFIAACHSPECPVSPSVFEELEKKYGSLTCWTKSERKLMFDCINAKLMEVHQQCTDPRSWMKLKWKKTELQERLHKLVSNQHKKVNKDAGENVLARESQWLNIGEDIDVIGREIERVLIDELVGEVVTM
ncbi:uncharacterized protein LOC116106458 [Pistacia vera]|uniref:uncharacterized protein LOC116106458 n=1 Tax=Pistacia vera TaxID=55513 RepID=UPI0012632A20|nr:uncharacterized protein LOC116106458 [Pistacia vera]